MSDLFVLVAAGSIGQAIARRVSAKKKLLVHPTQPGLADMRVRPGHHHQIVHAPSCPARCLRPRRAVTRVNPLMSDGLARFSLAPRRPVLNGSSRCSGDAFASASLRSGARMLDSALHL